MFIRTLASNSWGPDAEPVPFRRADGAPPGGRWRCRGDGPHDYVFVVVASPGMWAEFCRAVKRPDLIDDERFARGRDRIERADEIREIFQPWFSERTKREVMSVLGDAGVPVSAAFDTSEVFRDPHLQGRDFFVTHEHPAKGELLVMKPPFRLSRSEVELTRAPLVGEHSREVLTAELDLGEDDLDDLVAQGVVAGG